MQLMLQIIANINTVAGNNTDVNYCCRSNDADVSTVAGISM